MPRAFNSLGAVFDVETHPAELEDSGTVLRYAKRENFRQWHPSPVSVNQLAENRRTLRLALW